MSANFCQAPIFATLCYMRRNKKRPILLLVFGLLSLASLIYVIFFLNPQTSYQILNTKYSILIILFLLLFLSFFSLFSFLFNNKRRGLFVSLLAVLYLLLRYNNLTHPFFLITLIALFIILELLFSRQT